MAEFLTTKGITHYLDKIIDDAQKELVLISPYIKADDTTKDLLKNKTRATSINVIYGKAELKPSERSPSLTRLASRLHFIENLHAKCYLNEDHALLTSMNLYQFSQEHNDEMGILVSREDDAELYEAIYRQAMRWKTASNEIHVAENGKAYSAAKGARTQPQPTLEKPKGFCMRCKAGIPANPKQPYCKTCYASWNQYKNPAYKEKHCHTCGREHAATLRKPLCTTCYKKYADMFTFVTS